jgi:tRNA(Ile)-lysidine synthase
MSVGSWPADPKAADLLRRVESFIRSHRLIPPDVPVLVGVSGGPDSVFLLEALRLLAPPWGWRLQVAHLDHGFRGEESAADARFVQELCRGRGIPVTVECRSVPNLRLPGESPQEAARRIRLDFFRSAAALAGAPRTALGHTADDRAETLLLRLVTGGDPGALAGIRPRGPQGIVHPILEVPKEAILSFLAAAGIPHRTDRSNLSPRYLRNRIRLEVLPPVLGLNPSFARRARVIGEDLARDDAYLAGRASAWFRRAATPSPQGVSLPLEGLRRLHPAIRHRVVRLACVEAGLPPRRLSHIHLSLLGDLLRGEETETELTLPAGFRALRQGSSLLLRRPSPPVAPVPEVPLAVPGCTAVPFLTCRITVRRLQPPFPAVVSGPGEILVDEGRIAGALRIRVRRPGDWFIPAGLGHRQKIKKFLIDRKIPRGVRDGIPLVVDGEKVVWVAGLRGDDRSRVTPATTAALLISLTPAAP